MDQSVSIDPDHLRAIEGTALFYPCCGDDLGVPVRLFSPVVAAFYFVDVRRPRRSSVPETDLIPISRTHSPGCGRFQDRVTGNQFDLCRWKARGEDAFADVERLGVFFHRGDTLANGEGSSGVPWLGREWLTKILGKLVPGGLLVTDGSNCPTDGPQELSQFQLDRTVGSKAATRTKSFEFSGRLLSCIGYVGERYGPTLIWKAD